MVADEIKNKIYDYLSSVGKANYLDLAKRFLFSNSNSKLSEYDAIRKRLKTIIFDDERFVLNDEFVQLKKKFLKNYLLETEFVIADMETTGLSPYKDKITEIALVKVKNGEITDTFKTLVDPQVPIPHRITMLTGITDKMVSHKPTINEIILKVREFIGDSVFVAHNADFDYSFIKHVIRKYIGENLENPSLCTVKLSKKLIPSLPKASLDNVCEFLGIENEERHRAMGDAIACTKVFFHLLKYAIDRGFFTLHSLIGLQSARKKVKALPIKFNVETLNNFPVKPGIYIMRDKDRKILYIGKAKNLKKRVKSYFYNINTNPPKLIKLIQEIAYIDYKLTGSELEALLLEAEQIKQFLPPYNRKLKYPKNYYFLRINLNDSFPFIEISKRLKCDKSLYFGPFSNVNAFKKCIDVIKTCLKLRECKKRLKITKKNIPCMYYEMGKCSAPCSMEISHTDYKKKIFDFVKILENDKTVLEKYRTKDNKYLVDAVTKLEYFRQTLDKAIHNNSFFAVLDGVKDYEAKLLVVIEGRIEEFIKLNRNSINVESLYNRLKKKYIKPEELTFGFETEEIGLNKRMIRKTEIEQMMIIASYYNRNRNEKYILDMEDFSKKRFKGFMEGNFPNIEA